MFPQVKKNTNIVTPQTAMPVPTYELNQHNEGSATE
jgi:hypothetical protein